MPGPLAGPARLRPFALDDWQRTLPWRSDPELRNLLLGYRFPVTAEKEQDWVRKIVTDNGNCRCVYAVESAADGELVGFVQLVGMELIDRHAELGICIAAEGRRHAGLGSHALQLLLAQAFDVFNLNRVWVRVAGFNTRGQGFFVKNGFVPEGCFRSHVYVDGQYHDVLLFGLLADDWRVVPPVAG